MSNLNDSATLVELGKDIVLSENDVNRALSSPLHQKHVEEGKEAQ